MLKRKRKDDDDDDEKEQKMLSTEEERWVSRWRNLEIKKPLDDLKSEFYVMYGSSLSQIKCLAISMFDLIIGYLEPILVIILSSDCLAIDLFGDRELSILPLYRATPILSMRTEAQVHCHGGLILYDHLHSNMSLVDVPHCRSTPSSSVCLELPYFERDMTDQRSQFNFLHYTPISNADKTNPLAVTTYYCTKSLLFIDEEIFSCVGNILRTWSSDEGRTLNVLTLVQNRQLWWSKPFSTKDEKDKDRDKKIEYYVIPDDISAFRENLEHQHVIPSSDGNEIVVWLKIIRREKQYKDYQEYKDYRLLWKRCGSTHLSQSDWYLSYMTLFTSTNTYYGTSSHQSGTNCCPSRDHPIISMASLMHSNFSNSLGFVRFPFMRIRLYHLYIEKATGVMELTDEFGLVIKICRPSNFEFPKAFKDTIRFATDFITCGLQISEYPDLV